MLSALRSRPNCLTFYNLPARLVRSITLATVHVPRSEEAGPWIYMLHAPELQVEWEEAAGAPEKRLVRLAVPSAICRHANKCSNCCCAGFFPLPFTDLSNVNASWPTRRRTGLLPGRSTNLRKMLGSEQTGCPRRWRHGISVHPAKRHAIGNEPRRHAEQPSKLHGAYRWFLLAVAGSTTSCACGRNRESLSTAGI